MLDRIGKADRLFLVQFYHLVVDFEGEVISLGFNGYAISPTVAW